MRLSIAHTRGLLLTALIAVIAVSSVIAWRAAASYAERDAQAQATAGYLLYPRLGLCVQPTPAKSSEGGATIVRRAGADMRSLRKPSAIMPPALGQSLNSALLAQIIR